jgi:ABC-type glutathione transport system ATPase component
MALLKVHDLTVRYASGRSPSRTVIDHAAFTIEEGECVGLTGPSGCGKTSTALAILGLLPPSAQLSGSIEFKGLELVGLPERNLRGIRGASISIVFQESALALSPVLTVGAQIVEVIRAHSGYERGHARAQAISVMREVGLRDQADRIFDSYPHQLSGGQRQRILIAQAIACRPQLVIADEPTASLDADVRREILQLIHDLKQRRGTSFLLISHSPEVLATAADRVIQMDEGRVDEQRRPIVTGNDAFLASLPFSAGLRREGQSSIVDVIGLTKTYGRRRLFGRSRVPALAGIDLTVHQGVTLGLAGASGCGKSTLARCIAGLERPDSGEIWIHGRDITTLRHCELLPFRNHTQLIFQDSASALNPRFTAAELVSEPLLIQRVAPTAERRVRALELMTQVGLPADRANARPGEFSGGERQRLAIARSLAVRPRLLILDEALSNLDLANRARVLNLLGRLRASNDLTYLCVSHDLELLAQIASQVAVMQGGRIVDRVTRDSRLGPRGLRNAERPDPGSRIPNPDQAAAEPMVAAS